MLKTIVKKEMMNGRIFSMNELDFLNIVAEVMKKCIDNSPNFTEWEKACRKAYEDEVKEFAKQYYHSLD